MRTIKRENDPVVAINVYQLDNEESTLVFFSDIANFFNHVMIPSLDDLMSDPNGVMIKPTVCHIFLATDEQIEAYEASTNSAVDDYLTREE